MDSSVHHKPRTSVSASQSDTHSTVSSAEADTTFATYAACNIDPKHVNPDDAWQCKPIELNIAHAETEIRRDYIFDEYVIISPGRGKRPYDTSKNRHPLVETASSPRLDDQAAIFALTEDHHWTVKVVGNKYPALTMTNPKARGEQEIVIDTPLSNTPFAHLPKSQIERVLGVYQLRIKKLLAKDEIAYVLVFRNDGFEAGASLAHAHSQIYALPLVPKRFMEHSKLIEQYFVDKKKEPIEDILDFERDQKIRVVAEDDHFMVICPYASQYPFETWFIPKKHVLRFDEFSGAQIASCAEHLKRVTSKLTDSQISYNFFIENGTSPNYRCIVKLYGRSNIWGGFEVATEMVINTVPPEAAAEWYRSK